jgi:hypothetical protein
MEGFDIDPFMTPKNECKLLLNKGPTNALKRKKGFKKIMDSLHFNYSIAMFCHHHFMFYN